MKTIILPLVAGAISGVSTPQLQDPSALPGNAAAGFGSAIVDVAAPAYTDGTYTGPAVDAYWGDIQVQAIIQKGQIASLKMLRYPSDRRESQIINQVALPRLRDEVVRVQAAQVDIVSGATLTSEAFIRSLGAALGQANGGASPSAPATPASPTTRTQGNVNRLGI